MKVKHILVLLLVSWIIIVVGSLYKLTHRPGADLLLTIGFWTKGLAFVLFIIKLFTMKKFREFLDS